MKVSFNRDQLTFKFVVDEENYQEDLLMGVRLEKLMSFEEWKILAAEWLKADVLYRQAIMKVGMTDETDKKTAKKAAAYNGFTEAVTLCQSIVDACNDYRKQMKKQADEMERLAANADANDLAVPTYD